VGYAAILFEQRMNPGQLIGKVLRQIWHKTNFEDGCLPRCCGV
jgi:hypothetical protein